MKQQVKIMIPDEENSIMTENGNLPDIDQISSAQFQESIQSQSKFQWGFFKELKKKVYPKILMVEQKSKEKSRQFERETKEGVHPLRY